MYKLIKNFLNISDADFKIVFPLWEMIDKTPDPRDELHIYSKTKDEIPLYRIDLYNEYEEVVNKLNGYNGVDRFWISDDYLRIVYYFDTLENCVAGYRDFHSISKNSKLIRSWAIELPDGTIKYYN